jgi:nickel/cobalt transporter (NicO) family protein
VTTGQIIFFGLSGGLLPCPAALTVLLLCLQLKKFTLGFSLVLSFSFGLALTLVAIGSVAAWGAKHANKRLSAFSRYARRMPYFSSVLILLLGIYLIYSGIHKMS